MSSENKNQRISILGKKRYRLAIFFVLGAILSGLAYSSGSLFGGPALNVSAQEGDESMEDSMSEEQFMAPTTAGIDMNASRIVVSGSASSPGVESGPFQILPILPERTDGKIYVGTIYFTASAPVYVIPGFGFDAKNQTLDHAMFGELIRFPSESSFAGNSLAPAEIAHGPIMPNYSPQIDSDIGELPKVYSATVPFAGEVLEVGDVNGTNFLISYTVVADVHDTMRVSAMEPAILNNSQVEQQGNKVSITYGAAEKRSDAFSPNPILTKVGENVTWTNDDIMPHTVTSGIPEQSGANTVGQEFDSGFIGARSSFTHAFNARGEFQYFCQLHPNMIGTISVR